MCNANTIFFRECPSSVCGDLLISGLDAGTCLQAGSDCTEPMGALASSDISCETTLNLFNNNCDYDIGSFLGLGPATIREVCPISCNDCQAELIQSETYPTGQSLEIRNITLSKFVFFNLQK